MEVRLSKVIGKGFWESHRQVKAGCTELVEAGGRGSGKSSFISIELILQLLKNPSCHAVVMRKVASTLRTSVYAQVIWAIHALGLGEYFRCSLSPLECEYLPTGQKILFFGMDDAGKLKSLKMPWGYIGIAWFEEMDQFDQEEIRSAEQSLFRGGDFSLSLKSFNPPASEKHWANRYLLEEKAGKFSHKSTYLELPEGWLGERFYRDAEHLQKVNPKLYQLEYLGVPIGSGDGAFPNLRLEPSPSRRAPCHLSQGERLSSPAGGAVMPDGMTERVRLVKACGVDWGWWPDPWAFNRVAYDPENRILYILSELHCYRTGNRETGLMVKNIIPKGEIITADSAEPKSIGDYRQLGLCCRSAKKGPGSVAYGLKWLQSLAAIVVDPAVCPETAREFAACRYVDGVIPDKDNHHIDAVRYASQVFWRN